MMAVYCSAALRVPFQYYDDSTAFTSLTCTNNVDYNLSDEDVEWLYANFTPMTSTSRICGITNCWFCS